MNNWSEAKRDKINMAKVMVEKLKRVQNLQYMNKLP